MIFLKAKTKRDLVEVGSRSHHSLGQQHYFSVHLVIRSKQTLRHVTENVSVGPQASLQGVYSPQAVTYK